MILFFVQYTVDLVSLSAIFISRDYVAPSNCIVRKSSKLSSASYTLSSSW